MNGSLIQFTRAVASNKQEWLDDSEYPNVTRKNVWIYTDEQRFRMYGSFWESCW